MRPNTKTKSLAQEKRVAKELKGRTVIASGALWASKADVRNDQFLVECKTTAKDHYVLNYSTWSKINHEALSDGFREPVMCIDLLDGKCRLAVLDYLVNSDYILYLCEQNPNIRIERVFTSKSSKSIKYRMDTWELIFPDKRFMSGNKSKNIDLIITPWESFCEYLEVLDREER